MKPSKLNTKKSVGKATIQKVVAESIPLPKPPPTDGTVPIPPAVPKPKDKDIAVRVEGN